MAVYAIIQSGICINTIIAEQELANKIGAVECPNSYGIGDVYDGGTWHKATADEPAPPTPEERLSAVEAATLALMGVTGDV